MLCYVIIKINTYNKIIDVLVFNLMEMSEISIQMCEIMLLPGGAFSVLKYRFLFWSTVFCSEVPFSILK